MEGSSLSRLSYSYTVGPGYEIRGDQSSPIEDKGDYSKFNANKGSYKNPSESFGGSGKFYGDTTKNTATPHPT